MYAAGTCDGVEADTSRCNENATSYFATFEYDGYRFIVSSGVPDHGYTQINPNAMCERWQFAYMRLDPSSKEDSPRDTTLGTMGWASSGAVFYDVRSDNNGSTAWYNEGDSLDECNGHSDRTNQYHYHMTPKCMDGADEPAKCVTIGYYTDGFEIRGRCQNSDGIELLSCYKLKDDTVKGAYMSDYEFDQEAYDASECHLDEANGYTFEDGTYAYVMSTDYPYVQPYFYGRGRNARATV